MSLLACSQCGGVLEPLVMAVLSSMSLVALFLAPIRRWITGLFRKTS